MTEMARLAGATRTRASRDDRLDAVFHALGHRTRRALLARLRAKPAMITELAKPFAMSLPALSRHIRVLEDAGLIARTVDGRVHQCALNAEPLKSVEAWLGHYREFWEGTLESLARHIEAAAATPKR
jgi:DNA-binding transcriptional ArsR family regulator